MVQSRSLALVLLAFLLGACAHYQHYQPAPLAPAAEAARYAGRRLDDPALARFLSTHDAAVHDSAWNSRQLALAALYFRADLAEAQQSLSAARAAEITAGLRPAPSATATAERAARADEGHSTPWTFSLTTGLTFELGGKRAARLAHARAVTLASRLRLESTAWQVAQRARQATAVSLGAERDLVDARAETAELDTLLDLLRARYTEGRIARAELARSETDVQSSAVATVQATRASTEARLSLARALAVPLRDVETLPLRPDARSACAALDSLMLDTLETVALTTRADVGAALADYAAADAALRLQIAQQYPDITIGPGITWEQGIRRWVLALGFPSIPVNRARGPIAEARARRAVQAARVTLVQDSILAAVDSSAAACRSARTTVAAADSLVRATQRESAITNAAYERGEVGQTEVAFAQLALVRAERIRNQAAARSAVAGVALEDATGTWLSGPPIRWPDLLVPPTPALDGKRPDQQ